MRKAVVVIGVLLLSGLSVAAEREPAADKAAITAKIVADRLAPRDEDAIRVSCLALMRERTVVSVTVADAAGMLVFAERKDGESVRREKAFALEKQGVKGTLTVGFTDTPFDAESFDRELNEFRYTLYPYLEKFDYQSFDLNDSKYPELNTAVGKFMKGKSAEVKRYREIILWSNAGVPDLSSYGADEFNPADETVDGERVEDYLKSRSMISFVAINPYAMFNFAVTSHLSRSEKIEEVAVRSIRLQIASARVTARRDNGPRWDVWVDEYDRIYLVGYDTETGLASLKGIYKRKK